jgi:hypothetical protein
MAGRTVVSNAYRGNLEKVSIELPAGLIGLAGLYEVDIEGAARAGILKALGQEVTQIRLEKRAEKLSGDLYRVIPGRPPAPTPTKQTG